MHRGLFEGPENHASDGHTLRNGQFAFYPVELPVQARTIGITSSNHL